MMEKKRLLKYRTLTVTLWSLPYLIKIVLDNLSSKTSVMLGKGTLLLTFKQQDVASQKQVENCLLSAGY